MSGCLDAPERQGLHNFGAGDLILFEGKEIEEQKI
jgi:hypothetical protein